MKTLTTVLVLLLTLGRLSASVDPLDVLVMEDPTSNTLVIRTIVPMAYATDMVLVDEHGTQVFQAEIAPGSFVCKRFPTTNLPAGKYILHLEDEQGRTTLPFSHGDRGIAFSATESWRTIFPAVDLQDDGTLIVSYRPTGGKAMNVELAGSDGRTVFTDNVRADSGTRKAYRLNQLHAGTYTLTFNSPVTPTHRKQITIR